MKITKSQIIELLDDKEYFEEKEEHSKNSYIFHIESSNPKRSGIAYQFDVHGYLVDVYSWSD